LRLPGPRARFWRVLKVSERSGPWTHSRMGSRAGGSGPRASGDEGSVGLMIEAGARLVGVFQSPEDGERSCPAAGSRIVSRMSRACCQLSRAAAACPADRTHGPLHQPRRVDLPALHQRAPAHHGRRGSRSGAVRARSDGGRFLMPWHVCGTPRRSLALPFRNPRSSCALTWDFVGAPSATRTRDLLLRRQLLCPLSYRGHTDKPAGCRPHQA
jgi:hypothetical protein